MYFAGVDIGSTMSKIVIIDEKEKLCSRVVSVTGPEHRRLANKVMEEALKQARLSFEEISYVIATGYGRMNVPFADNQITELTCHAKGVATLFPSARTVIDIGGQDSKGLKINNGKLVNFVMNDKCAAGTGRFLEVITDSLGLKVEDLGNISLRAKNKVKINNICTIFAQQEVISHIADGMPIEDIVAGLHDAIASRVIRMLQRLNIERDVVFTGGVAKNVGVVKAIKENLGYDILIPEDPFISGALGAAILGKEFVMQCMERGEPIRKKERCLREVTFYE